MRSKELLIRRLELTALIGLLFIVTACGPQPAAAVMAEQDQSYTVTYVVCNDKDRNGACNTGDDLIAGVPATIVYTNGTTLETQTDENGSVSYISPEQSGMNIDLAIIEEMTGLCRTNHSPEPRPGQMIYDLTFKPCNEMSS